MRIGRSMWIAHAGHFGSRGCARVILAGRLNDLNQKQKSNNAGFNIELKPTIDIAQKIGGLKRKDQVIVGSDQ